MSLRKLFPLCKEQALVVVNRSLPVRKISTKSPDYSISSIYSSIKKRFNSSNKTMEALEGPIIGIDLGTTKSCVAVMEGDVPKILENKEVPRKTPSYVTVTDKGNPIIGNKVKHQPFINPEHTMFSTKRLFEEWLDQSGFKYNRHGIPFLPHKLMTTTRDGLLYDASEDVIAYILRKLKHSAESYMKTSIHGAVISCPPYLANEMIQKASERAGFQLVHSFKESFRVESAISFKSFKKKMAVYDFGGGKFSFKICKNGKRMCHDQNWIPNFGGVYFDYVLTNDLKKGFMEQTGIDLSNNILEMCKIREAVIDAKILLSQATEVEINIPELAVGSCGRYMDFSTRITREEFESFYHDMFKETISFSHNYLKSHNTKKEEIDGVVLLGGMTKIPKVRKMVEEYFEQTAIDGFDPDEAAAIGALYEAEKIRRIPVESIFDDI